MTSGDSTRPVLPNRAVLAAIDGSPASQAAATVAAKIAKAEGLAVRGLYVVGERDVMDPYANYGTEIQMDAKPTSREELMTMFQAEGEYALNWLESLCQTEGIAYSSNMLFGSITDVVIEQAGAADMLALGQYGNHQRENVGSLGNHFKQIVHHVQVPVIAGGALARPVQRVLLAYDGSQGAQKALEWAARIQQDLPNKLTVLAMTGADHPQEWEHRVREKVDQCVLHGYEWLLRSGEPANEIVEIAKEGQADLIVLGRYSHTALVEWLEGSVLDAVLRGTQITTLIA